MSPELEKIATIQAACSHPWEHVNHTDEHGYICKLCDAPLVYCWSCAASGVYDMHPAPECFAEHLFRVNSTKTKGVYVAD